MLAPTRIISLSHTLYLYIYIPTSLILNLCTALKVINDG